MKWQSMLAEWRQVQHKVRQHWMLPKVEHGKAQVPYFHGQEQIDLLNRNMGLRHALCNTFLNPEPEGDMK
jgi:hypothetical protein